MIRFALRGGGITALLLLLLAMPTRAGDVDAAKLFLDTARTKMRARKYEEALLLLQKASHEDAGLLEAYWLEGQIHEKLKAPGSALAAYRKFVEAYGRKAQQGHVEDADAKLRKKVDKRVDVLAAGERALEACEEEYVEDLLALAQKHAEDAPSVSLQALELALELRPRHAEVLALYQELGGTPPEDCSSPTLGKTPFDRWTYTSTTDLIEQDSFGTTKSVTPVDGGIKVVASGSGSLITPSERIAASREYVVHASFRLLDRSSPRWLTGLVFGISGKGIERFFSAFVQTDKLILHRVDKGTGERGDVANQRIPTIQPGQWHDLLVHVVDRRIEVLFDGKKLVNYTAPREFDMQGGLGIYLQSGESEFRALRIGRVE